MNVLRILNCVPTFVVCCAVTIIAAIVEWLNATASLIYNALKEAVWCNGQEIVQDYKVARHEERCAERRERRRKEAINV